MKTHNLSVSTKLWLAVLLLIATLLGVITFAAWRSADLTQKNEAVTAEGKEAVRKANQWANTAEVVVTRLQAIIVSPNSEVAASYKEANARDQARIAEWQKSLEARAASPDERALMEKIARERATALALVPAMEEQKNAGNADGAHAIFTRDFMPALQKYLQSLGDFAALQESQAEAARKDIVDQRNAIVKVSAVFIVIVIVGALAGASLLIRSIHVPLKQAVDLAHGIAHGDLTQTIDTSRRDEFGQMMRALKEMNDSLSRVVGLVRDSTDSVVTASEQIAAGNMDLSARTEHQASSLEQTASSLEELTSTVKHNADNARQANHLAASASDVAVRGGAVVSDVVHTMGEIDESAKKIVDIISVIDGIAFQTNILALNAAVEAARAGEQGRGFAVVASEVRSLAQRSAGAAKEIKNLITDSVEKVNTGAKLVDQAGATMQEIVDSVRRVTDIMGEITAASQEQTTGIEQINQAVAQMDQTTQQNASLVEEAAAASETMKEQAVRLAEAVSVFRIDTQYAAPKLAQRASRKENSSVAAAPGNARKGGSVIPMPVVKKEPGAKPAGGDWEEF